MIITIITIGFNCHFDVLFLSGFRRKRKVPSKACTYKEFDVVNAYLPQGLHVPNVSIPPNAIPTWKFYKRKNLEAFFEFGYAYLTYNGPLILFVFEKKMLGTM